MKSTAVSRFATNSRINASVSAWTVTSRAVPGSSAIKRDGLLASAMALALLIVAVNLVSDAYIRQLDRSSETQ